MGYACPVCGVPQRDGEHLANHLAFTAMLDDGDHAAWLDEHAPDWDEQGPDDLAPRVTEHAPETEYEEVFEDTVAHRATSSRTQSGDTVQRDGHTHDDDRGGALFDNEGGNGPGRTDFDANAARQRGGVADLDEEAQGILSEARDMTQEMLGEDGDPEDGTGGTDADAASEAADDEGKES
jgi:hypothetical protein